MSRIKEVIDANIKENGNQEITGKVLNYVLNEMVNEANKEGYYPRVSVGFADHLSGHGESTPEEFSFRASGGKSILDGVARVKTLKGNSVVWNQKARQDLESSSAAGLTATWEGNKIHIQGVVNRDTDINIYSLVKNPTTIEGHKYLARIEGSELIDFYAYGSIVNSNIYHQAILEATNGAANLTLRPSDGVTSGQTIDVYISFQFSDLTQMFGAGNEPTTIEEYNARKPILADEYAYNEGELLHSHIDAIKSVGDNAWDEEWEQGILDVNGENYYLEGYIRSKNYIPIIGGAQYYYSNKEGKIEDYLAMRFYDENKVLVDSFTQAIGTFTAPRNARYMRFYPNGTYGGTYKNDIMLTLVHSGWKQDTDAGYQPYWADVLNVDPRIKAEFPNGMQKWDKAFNRNGKGYVVKGTGYLGNIGSHITNYTSTAYGKVRWVIESLQNVIAKPSRSNIVGGVLCAEYPTRIADEGYVEKVAISVEPNGHITIFDSELNTPSDYTSRRIHDKLQDVGLYYQLAEPIIIEFDQPFNFDYRVADFGTEEAIADQPSAPLAADIIYRFNAVDMIRELYRKVQELEARL